MMDETGQHMAPICPGPQASGSAETALTGRPAEQDVQSQDPGEKSPSKAVLRTQKSRWML